MTKLFAALATGVFCACFAFAVDVITDALSMWQVIGLASVSGFLGSFVGNSAFGRSK